MASSLSNLLNNLAERIYKIKSKYGHNDKKCETYRINISIATVFLNTQTLNMIKQNANVYFVTKIIRKNLMKS